MVRARLVLSGCFWKELEDQAANDLESMEVRAGYREDPILVDGFT